MTATTHDSIAAHAEEFQSPTPGLACAEAVLDAIRMALIAAILAPDGADAAPIFKVSQSTPD